MQIGEVICKYRKEKQMTQEEMAEKLGVSTPAVNKWEKGRSYPDITLLPPLARLLNISLDTLLSFQGELTEAEINSILEKTEEDLMKRPFEEVFLDAKKRTEQYPDCRKLSLYLAAALDGYRMMKPVKEDEKYDQYIINRYEEALKSEEEALRMQAGELLFSFYLRKENYEKAETYLDVFSKENPERKRKQAQLYALTGKNREAYRTYEEVLFAQYQVVYGAFLGIYMLAMKEKKMDKAREMVKKLEGLAKLFEMGRYHEISCGLELAYAEKDAEKIKEIQDEMLAHVEEIGDFSKAKLYEHMDFKEIRKEHVDKIKDNLVECFQDRESFDF